MNIVPSVEGAREVREYLARLGKQAPIGLRIWQNSVGEHMQTSQRGALPQRFSLRGTGQRFSQAIVFAKATPQQRNAILRVGSDSVGNSATAKLGRLLARHEDGGSRESRNSVKLSSGGTKDVGFFIPSDKFRTKTSNPPRSLYPSSIGASLYRQVDGSFKYNSSVKKTRKVKGELKIGQTFVVTEQGIFRWKHDFGSTSNRKGQSFSDRAEPVWWFSKRVRSPARLRLWETAQSVFDRFAASYAYEAMEIVIERSR